MSDLLKALETSASKDELLNKMAELPKWATHVGIANTELGITAVVGSALETPAVYDPSTQRWVQLVTKIGG